MAKIPVGLKEELFEIIESPTLIKKKFKIKGGKLFKALPTKEQVFTGENTKTVTPLEIMEKAIAEPCTNDLDLELSNSPNTVYASNSMGQKSKSNAKSGFILPENTPVLRQDRVVKPNMKVQAHLRRKAVSLLDTYQPMRHSMYSTIEQKHFNESAKNKKQGIEKMTEEEIKARRLVAATTMLSGYVLPTHSVDLSIS